VAADPRFEALRGTPKFASLLRRMMLAEDEEIRAQGA